MINLPESKLLYAHELPKTLAHRSAYHQSNRYSFYTQLSIRKDLA